MDGHARVHMDAKDFFIGAREMCDLLGTSARRLGTYAGASYWGRLLVFGGAPAARGLLQCSEGSCLSLVRGPRSVNHSGWGFPLLRPSAATILIYATVALLTLLLLASVPSRIPHSHRRRLKLRHNTSAASSHHQIPFDPVIADIVRRREAREWERDHFRLPHQPEWDDFFDPQDYVDDEDRFNITHRIVVLFPRIDVAPADGFVSSTELAEWNFQQAIHRSGRELELCDSNGDGFISFEEYRQSGR
ncbi:hypothetical protein BHM03_00012391 [Ensete ventricosum]|nr:hypothetical protein BHM03_00012391 [Ensete ventricosum]